MSLYIFIACEYELPTLYSPKLHTPNGKRIAVYQSEEDLDHLEIIPEEVIIIIFFCCLTNICSERCADEVVL